MTNIDHAAEVLTDWVDSEGGLSAIDRDYDGDLTGGVEALADAGLLTPEPQIIRTRDQLAALDPETILDTLVEVPYRAHEAVNAIDAGEWEGAWLPAVVIRTGDQARATRQALEAA